MLPVGLAWLERHKHLHVPAVLAANLIQRCADLPQRGDFDRFHQFGENVAAAHGGLLQPLESFGSFRCVLRLEGAQVVDLVALLLFG